MMNTNTDNIQKWRRYSRPQIRAIIFKKLLDYPFGATATQLSRDLNLSRKVTSRELKQLWLGDDKIGLLIVGNCKIFMRKRYYDKRIKKT